MVITRRKRILIASRNPDLVIVLRDALSSSESQLVGVIDPALRSEMVRWQDYADVLILSASDLKRIEQNDPKIAKKIAMDQVVILVASAEDLLGAFASEERALGVIFDPEQKELAAPIIRLAGEGRGYLVIPPEYAVLLPDEGLRRTMAESLTDAELRVLRLLGQARSNREIAKVLDCSESRVKMLVSSVLNKLRLENRTAAAVFSARHGYADAHGPKPTKTD
jgi:DNA-binding NarL/FixJ family response regulator